MGVEDRHGMGGNGGPPFNPEPHHCGDHNCSGGERTIENQGRDSRGRFTAKVAIVSFCLVCYIISQGWTPPSK